MGESGERTSSFSRDPLECDCMLLDYCLLDVLNIERNTLCSIYGLRSVCKQLKQLVKVVIDLLPQHLVERLYSTPTIKNQEVSSLHNKYYWSGCFLRRLLGDYDHNRVLDIAAKVFKETHVNSGGEKAHSLSPLCLKCDYFNRMGHFVYTLLP